MKAIKHVVALSVCIILGMAALTPAVSPADPGFACDCDRYYYYRLANGQTTHAPFGWRLLNPALARLTGLPLPTAFHALTMLWLALLGPACYFMLRSARIAPLYSAVGALLVYTLYWIAPFNLSGPYLPDPLAFLFLVLAIAFAYRRQSSGFMLALAIGVLAKETVLVAIPVWYALDPRHSIRSAILVALPALVVFAAIRVVLPEPRYSLMALPGKVAEWRLTHPVEPLELLPFGVLPLLALLDWRRNMRVLVAYAPMLGLVYAQLIVASDVGRLLVYGFPPLLVMAAQGIEKTRGEFIAPLQGGRNHGS